VCRRSKGQIHAILTKENVAQPQAPPRGRCLLSQGFVNWPSWAVFGRGSIVERRTKLCLPRIAVIFLFAASMLAWGDLQHAHRVSRAEAS
jgi:hypothetical protein